MSYSFTAAEPYPFTLQPNKPALVLIDMQRDFVEEGGFGSSLGNDVSLLRAIIPELNNLLQCARELGLPIVHTREAHQPDLSDCPEAKRQRGRCSLRIGDQGPMGRLLIEGEAGNNLVPELQPLDGELNIAKPGKGMFYNTPVQEWLQAQGVTQLLFTGVTTEVCVQTSMREANDRGYECLIVEDCTESYFPAFKQAAIEMMIAQDAIIGWKANSQALQQALRECYTS